jgi:hypothetical protein
VLRVDDINDTESIFAAWTACLASCRAACLRDLELVRVFFEEVVVLASDWAPCAWLELFADWAACAWL